MSAPATLKPFHETPASWLDTDTLRRQMDVRGYVFIPNLLRLDDLRSLLGQIVEVLDAAGWLLPGHNPLDCIANLDATCRNGDPAFEPVYDRVFSLESFHALAHHPGLRRIAQLLVGPRLFIHPKPMGRLVFPHDDSFTPMAHQDFRGIGGTPDTFTAWIPLHDCPPELGPLKILEGSHLFGLQDTGSRTSGVLPLDHCLGGDWVGGRINAGDVVIFHALTVHTGSANTSNRLRISLDTRFQDYTAPIDPAALVFPGGRYSWQDTYANWRSADLQYFWKKFPLRLHPTPAELAALAETHESPQMRERFASILAQIDSELLVS